jgi:hypothetical protein
MVHSTSSYIGDRFMINPFTNDSKVQEMKKLGAFNYAVIYPESNTKLDVMGFDDKIKIRPISTLQKSLRAACGFM